MESVNIACTCTLLVIPCLWVPHMPRHWLENESKNGRWKLWLRAYSERKREVCLWLYPEWNGLKVFSFCQFFSVQNQLYQMLRLHKRNVCKSNQLDKCIYEPPRDKTNKMACAHSELRSAWAFTQSDQSSLSTWRKLGSLDTHWVHSEDSHQTGRMPRLICLRWVQSFCWFCCEVAHV